MIRKMNARLVAGAGAVAFFAFAGLPAEAFDEVNWVWNADVSTSISTQANASVDVAPTGLNMAENEQQMQGDLISTSGVGEVSNVLGLGTSPNPITDLAAVSSDATAVGNNASITSDVQVNYDSMQSFAGVGSNLTDPLLGLAVPGTISAISDVNGVVNGSVASASTAVANNLTIELVTASDQDAFAIGNNEQFSAAIVTSDSTVSTVSFMDFADMGSLDNPAVGSSATAVGNNFSVEVDGIN